MGSNTDSNHHLTCTKTRRLCPKRPLTEHTHRMFLQERVAFITQLKVYIYKKKTVQYRVQRFFFSCDKKPFPRNVQCDYNPFTANQQQVLHYCTKTGAIINVAGGRGTFRTVREAVWRFEIIRICIKLRITKKKINLFCIESIDNEFRENV